MGEVGVGKKGERGRGAGAEMAEGAEDLKAQRAAETSNKMPMCFILILLTPDLTASSSIRVSSSDALRAASTGPR